MRCYPASTRSLSRLRRQPCARRSNAGSGISRSVPSIDADRLRPSALDSYVEPYASPSTPMISTPPTAVSPIVLVWALSPRWSLTE
jgi:hypothetical protein